MNFYELLLDEGGRKKYAWSFPAYDYPCEVVSCKKCNRVWNNMDRCFEENLPFTIVFTSNYFSDFQACEFLTLVNESVKECFEKNEIKGPLFSQMPVLKRKEMTHKQLKQYRISHNVNKFHDEDPIYYKLSAEIGAKYHKDSNIYWRVSKTDSCVYCGYGVGYRKKNYDDPSYIDLNSWNGNDLFRAEGLGLHLYCTEKVKNLIEEQGFTGVYFKTVEAR